jgi:hypothetical protein
LNQADELPHIFLLLADLVQVWSTPDQAKDGDAKLFGVVFSDGHASSAKGSFEKKLEEFCDLS